jgi:lauroyl/myristoyl acyltransferase
MKIRSLPGWNLFEYALVRVFAAPLEILPFEISSYFAHAIGAAAYFFHSGRRKTALNNISLALGNQCTAEQRHRLAQRSFSSVAASLIEFLTVRRTLREASSRFTFEGTEFMEAAFAKGKGVVFVISHLGSWEYLGFLPHLKKYPCSVVVKEIKNPYVNNWIQGLRQATGLKPF